MQLKLNSELRGRLLRQFATLSAGDWSEKIYMYIGYYYGGWLEHIKEVIIIKIEKNEWHSVVTTREY